MLFNTASTKPKITNLLRPKISESLPPLWAPIPIPSAPENIKRPIVNSSNPRMFKRNTGNNNIPPERLVNPRKRVSDE